MSETVFRIGNYATPEQKGLYTCTYNDQEGFKVLAAFSGLTNPSYLTEHPEHPVIYTVEETAEGAVCAWKEEDGNLTLLNRLPTGGADPCYLSLSEDGRWLYAANYSGGSVACFRLDDAGVPAERTDLVQLEGSGPNPVRQEKAHAHCAFPFRGRIGVCDLGTDTVYLFKNNDGRLEESAAIKAPPGSGPRHLASHTSHPELLYCVTELSGEVLVWRETASGEFEEAGRIAALPKNHTGENTAAAIRFTQAGKRLLVSHRGLDAIAVMPVDEDGLPGEPVFSSCVHVPRDFRIFGETVLAGSQRDGELRAYRLEGRFLQDTGHRIVLPAPVCIQKALR